MEATSVQWLIRGAVKRKRRRGQYSTFEETKGLCELVICVRVCIFIDRYSYFTTVVGKKNVLLDLSFPCPINNPHLSS